MRSTMRIIKRNNFSRRSIIAYVFVFLTIIFAITVLSYTILTNRLEDELTNTNLALLRQINQRIDIMLKEIDRETINFISEQETRAFINADFIDDIQRYEYFNILMNKINILRSTNPSISSIYIYSDINRHILTHDAYSAVSDFFDHQWLEEYHHMKRYFSWLGTRRIDDRRLVNPVAKNVITLIRPFPIASNPEYWRGAIVVNVDEDVLYNIIRNAKPKESDQIYIINRGGRVLAHDEKAMLYADLAKEPYISSILPLKGEGRRDSEIDRVNVSIFYVDSAYTGWKYVSVVPHTQINRPLVAVRNILLLAAFIMFILVVAVVIAVSNWTYKPIGKFMDSIAKKIEGSDVDRSYGNCYESFEELENVFSDIISDREKIRRQIQESLPAIKWRLIMDILTGYRIDYDELSTHLDLIGVTLNRNNFVAMAAELDDKAELLRKSPSQGLRLYTANLCRLAEDFANRENKGAAIELNDGKVAVIMSFDSADPAVNLAKATDTAKLVQSSFQEYFGATITIGIGSACREISEIGCSFQEAVEALKYKVVLGRCSVIATGEIPAHSGKEVYRILSMANSISTSIKNADKSEVAKQIARMFDEVMDKRLSPDTIRQLSAQVIVQGVKAAMDTGLSIDDMFEDSDRSVDEILDNLETAEQISAYIGELFAGLVDKIIEKRNNRNNNELLHKMLEYIERNYANSELSLNMLADTFHISVTYLSKIFKEFTAANFLDYLTAMRIEKAKELLRNSGLKINEIAKKVGYTNEHSFIRVFRKHTGKTPGEYRRREILDQARR